MYNVVIKGLLSELPVSPLPVDSRGRYGTPSGYDGSGGRTRQEPIYEMFRVPDAASYNAPAGNVPK